MCPQPTAELTVDGRRLAIRNLDRVVFPRAGTTKGELLDYYVRIADAILPHLRERLLHMHRYPEGVEGPRFWQKGCPDHRPEWLPTAPVWSPDKQADIHFCVVNELAALLWAVNIGSIELHTSLHVRSDLHRPTVLAFDLDPGEGAGILDCCEVALRLRDLLGGVALRSLPKTSGSKGLRLRAAELGGLLCRDEARHACDRGAARGRDAGDRGLADGEGAALRQGARRLESEHRAQVDGLRLLGAGKTARVSAARARLANELATPMCSSAPSWA